MQSVEFFSCTTSSNAYACLNKALLFRVCGFMSKGERGRKVKSCMMEGREVLGGSGAPGSIHGLCVA